MPRIRYTRTSRRLREALGLSAADIASIIGDLESIEFDLEQSGLVRTRAAVRGQQYAVVFGADPDGLLVVTID